MLKSKCEPALLFTPKCEPALRNYDGDAEDKVDKKEILYFTYESRDTRKSFTFFITLN